MQSKTTVQALVFFLLLCVCMSVAVFDKGGGGSYSPSNHLLLQFRGKKKKIGDKGGVCMRVCACRVQSLPPTAVLVMAGFPPSSSLSP